MAGRTAEGRVAWAEDSYPDTPLTGPGPNAPANNIILDCGGGVYAQYAHLRKGSAAVHVGDWVRAGQKLACTGNSGQSAMPHLHFTLMDSDYFSIPGRFRLEQNAGSHWELKDGAALSEGTSLRPAPTPVRPDGTGNGAIPWQKE